MHSLSSKSTVHLDFVLYVHLKTWLCIALNRMFIHILGYPCPFLKILMSILNKTMKLYKKLKSFSTVGNQINLSRYSIFFFLNISKTIIMDINHVKGHNKNSRHIFFFFEKQIHDIYIVILIYTRHFKSLKQANCGVF